VKRASPRPPEPQAGDGELLEVERLGGFAGFGMPGSPLRSRGSVPMGRLSPRDRRAVDALFGAPPEDAPMPDDFRYRLTRQCTGGTQQCEVAGQHVPDVLKDCVRDELA
jgi:hypothetical protein